MITVVGEALLDLVAEAGGRAFTAHPGGSPANVAVGLARLGSPVRLATYFADDVAGRLISRHLRRSGVSVDLLPATSTATSLAFATVDDQGVASYDFRVTWDVTHGPVLGPECRCLHTGSIAAALRPGADVVDAMLTTERARDTVTICLDPNIRPSLVGPREAVRERVEQQVSRSDVVKVSAEDLSWLYPDEQPTRVATRWRDTGPALVMVTLGAAGACAIGHNVEVWRPAVPVDVVDTVGAGDAFTAGLLDGLRRADLLGGDQRDRLTAVDEATLTSLLDFALQIAGLTCARAGADPPRLAEL